MWNKLRNEPVNKTGYIKRIIAYGIDWFIITSSYFVIYVSS